MRSPQLVWDRDDRGLRSRRILSLLWSKHPPQEDLLSSTWNRDLGTLALSQRRERKLLFRPSSSLPGPVAAPGERHGQFATDFAQPDVGDVVGPGDRAEWILPDFVVEVGVAVGDRLVGHGDSTSNTWPHRNPVLDDARGSSWQSCALWRSAPALGSDASR